MATLCLALAEDRLSSYSKSVSLTKSTAANDYKVLYILAQLMPTSFIPISDKSPILHGTCVCNKANQLEQKTKKIVLVYKTGPAAKSGIAAMSTFGKGNSIWKYFVTYSLRILGPMSAEYLLIEIIIRNQERCSYRKQLE